MTQTPSSRLLIVDPHGKVVHRLTWEAGQYVADEEEIEAMLVSDDAIEIEPVLSKSI